MPQEEHRKDQDHRSQVCATAESFPMHAMVGSPVKLPGLGRGENLSNLNACDLISFSHVSKMCTWVPQEVSMSLGALLASFSTPSEGRGKRAEFIL